MAQYAVETFGVIVQTGEYQIFAVIGAVAMGVLSALFLLVWRVLRTRWAAFFSLSYACVTLFYAFDRYTLPTADRPNTLAALISLPTMLLATLGMLNFVGMQGRWAVWLTRVFSVTVVLACMLSVLQLVSRTVGFGTITFLFTLQLWLAVWALRNEPGHGHGLVIIALLLYPLLFLMGVLKFFPLVALRYWAVIPFAVNGMTILTTGLLRAQRRNEKAERALRALNESLERRVEQRTEELREAVTRVDQINERLTALNTSRTRLMAAACHDLRQPAHALGMLADAAAKQAPAAMRQPIENIRRCSASLSDMLDMLLDMSQLEEDRYRPTVTNVVLDDIFDDLRTQFEPVASRKGLSLTVDATPLSVLSDRHLLRRMVMNLVSNGLKYTSKGGVQLSACEEDGQVVICVADTGPGIPADKAEAVFADFVRLDGTRQAEGLGIGLPIVKRAAELLEHKVWLSSVVGQGCRFYLALAPSRLPAPARQVLPDVQGRNRLIGVLENDPHIMAATQALLTAHGFSVAMGRNLEEFKRELLAQGRESPDLLISDLHLDDVQDGLEVVQSLRQLPGWRDLKCVLMTGDLDLDVAARAAVMGVALAYKPVQPKRLLLLLEQVLQSEPAHRHEQGSSESSRQGASVR